MNILIKRGAIIFCSLLPLFTLTGCGPKKLTPAEAREHVRAALLQQIEYKGVKVIQQNHSLKMIFPTDKFFRLQSLRIKEYQIRTLRLSADYIQDYLQQCNMRKKITVTGYTDTVFTKQTRNKLSKQYAEVIANNLKTYGLSNEKIYVQGLGSSHPIANSKTTAGSGLNRRVEVRIQSVGNK